MDTRDAVLAALAERVRAAGHEARVLGAMLLNKDTNESWVLLIHMSLEPAEYNIDKAYNRKDIKSLLKLSPKAKVPSKATTKTPEFQEWFKAGIRICRNHPYPFVWCIIEGLACPKCRKESGVEEKDEW